MQEFKDIYDKEITKRYHDYEIKRLSKRKDRKRDTGAAGRPFKLDIRNRFLMLLVFTVGFTSMKISLYVGAL